MSPNWHPSADELGRCLRGELPDTQAGRVADHVDTCPDCQAALEAANRPSPVPLGQPPEIPGFTLLDDGRPIGAGGMGEVFRAVEDGIGREVAVKIVHRCHAANPHRSRLVFRFVEEVRLLGRMQHTGVPPVYRFGFLGDGADHPYLVMRLIPWPTLADELAADWAPGKGGPTPDRLNLYLIWFGRACEAVGYAHGRGAVHLDLKPANIKVHPSGEVQVLDWGLGRGFMATPDGRTRLFTPSAAEIDVGPVGHTAEYSPPEQIRGGHPDRKMHPRADVFALGSVLCEILTGRPAFAAATAHESYDRAWHADLTHALARLARAEGDYPQLVALARRCLAPEPENRPESAGEVAVEVRRIILSAEERLRTTKWRFRMWAGVAAATVLAAATAGGVAYRESEHERKEVQNQLRATIEQARADDATRALAATERERVEKQAEGHLRRAEEAERTTAAGDFARPAVREVMAVGWRLAAEQAKAADDAISGQAADAELVERVKAAARRIGTAHADFTADKALLDALDLARVAKTYPQDPDPSVRFSGAYFYSRRGADEYPAAFRLARLYTDSSAAREHLLTAVRARRPEVRAAVVAALDHWFLLDRRDDQRWMLKLADELDDDPGRGAVRSALRTGDVKALLAEQPDLRLRLTPEAALLAAAALEPWAGAGPGPPAGRDGAGLGEAAALLAPIAEKPAARGDHPAAYWVHLTCAFYLWNNSRPRQEAASKAIEHLRAAEGLVRGAPDDRSPAGVLRAAAGGFRAYAEACRAAPNVAEELARRAAAEYPGYWPAWQLLVLVRLDRGDETGALAAARGWRRAHQQSVLAKGYEAFVDGLTAPAPGEAARAIAELVKTHDDLSAVDRLQLDELRGELRVAPRPPADPDPTDRDGALHPHRPGRSLVTVVDARTRLDRVLAQALPAAGFPPAQLTFRPWAVALDDNGAELGRAAGAVWTVPKLALAGYDAEADTTPWATGVQFGYVRAKAAAGRVALAAEEADRHVGLPAAGPRAGLYHLYRARLHCAAADWTDDPGPAHEYRNRAAAALVAAVRTDPRLAAPAAAIQAEADRVELEYLAADIRGAGRDTPGRMCGRADVAFRRLGACWLSARFAGHPFVNEEKFAADPFAATVPGRDLTVARCVVLAAWGCRRPPHGSSALPVHAIPPDDRLDSRPRIDLLQQFRTRLATGAADPPARTLFDDPVIRAFAADVAAGVTLPAPAGLNDADRRYWKIEQMAWLGLLRGLRDRGELADGILP